MTDRPILFSGPMVRALLDGRKTQTRRVLKPQPVTDSGYWTHPKFPGGYPAEVLWMNYDPPMTDRSARQAEPLEKIELLEPTP